MSHKKIIVCPDSFKGSVSAQGASEAIKRGLLKADRSLEIIEVPIADGGEGTLDAIVNEKNMIYLTVKGTNMEDIQGRFGFMGDCAIIEMATAAGLCLVKESERNPEIASSYGVGQLISAALDKGYRKIMITVGGSGTNDGGCGMLEALGAKFYAKDGSLLSMCGKNLGKIKKINISGLDSRLKETEITFACDVTNPLLGVSGATYVYGAQKGADTQMLERLEKGMENYSLRLKEACGVDISHVPGCGAGGGLASSLVAIYGAKIKSGIKSVLEAVNFEKLLDGASLVITGEGKIDRQSAYGKAISGVANAAKAKNIPVLALVGIEGEGAEEMLNFGISKICSLSSIAKDAEYSMTHGEELLEKLSYTEVVKFLN